MPEPHYLLRQMNLRTGLINAVNSYKHASGEVKWGESVQLTVPPDINLPTLSSTYKEDFSSLLKLRDPPSK
jgi:hypothetical protein